MIPATSNLFTDTLQTDFKAEVIAAGMVENGTPLENILILLLGASKRPYRKDVDEIIEDIPEYDHKEYIHIKTHKEGIYDMLPEGLFHYPTLPKSATTEKEIIDAVKKHHIEEYNARKFFLPFEAAINDLRIQMALRESLLDKRQHNSRLVDIFSGQWEIFKLLDHRQSNIFLHLLPLVYNMRDDYNVAAVIFELIFLFPVTITVQPQLPVRCETPIYSTLENAILGVDLTTGNEVFETGDDEIIVTVGPVENAVLSQFMPGQNNARVLELLCDYFLPVHLDINVVVELNQADKTTRLADKQSDFNSTLGVCTYL